MKELFFLKLYICNSDDSNIVNKFILAICTFILLKRSATRRRRGSLFLLLLPTSSSPDEH